MVWFVVWTLLVLGTLAGAFLLGRHLWRAGTRLLREVSAAGATLGSSGDRISAAVAEAERNRVDTSPTLFDDPVLLRERVRARRLAAAARKAERHARYRATARTWEEPWLERRTAQTAEQRAARAVQARSTDRSPAGDLGNTRLP
jgi:hypothetical protein